MDFNVHPRKNCNALRPQKDIAVRQRNPEIVLGQAQQDRVIQNAPLGVGNQDIFALPHRHLGQVARRQHLHELCSIWTGDLYLPLNGHITQDRLIHEVPKVLFRVAKIARNIHMIINRKTLRAPPNGGVKEWGFSDLRAKTKVVCLCNFFALIAGGLTDQICLETCL